jgi:mRNA-degrading endonuclease RelE of RelBE toxin-antitoxin system
MDLELSSAARKQFGSIPAGDARRLLAALEEIAASHPRRPSFVTELVSSAGTWRVRKGNYRAIYQIDGDTMIVLAVGHRKEIYQ